MAFYFYDRNQLMDMYHAFNYKGLVIVQGL